MFSFEDDEEDDVRPGPSGQQSSMVNEELDWDSKTFRGTLTQICSGCENLVGCHGYDHSIFNIKDSRGCLISY